MIEEIMGKTFPFQLHSRDFIFEATKTVTLALHRVFVIRLEE